MINQCASQFDGKPVSKAEGLENAMPETKQPNETDGDSVDQSTVNINQSTRRKETRRRRTKGLGGLQLEKTGIWTLRCIINGKRISKSTGTRDRAEAEQFAKKFLAPYVKDDAARTFENIQAAVMTERQLAATHLRRAEAGDAHIYNRK